MGRFTLYCARKFAVEVLLKAYVCLSLLPLDLQAMPAVVTELLVLSAVVGAASRREVRAMPTQIIQLTQL
ncbi:hypothetical protein CK516_24550 [Nostoc sp. 'Peltigera malacea cyanobiont' DB3992]|nr:hypothetical protein CK516_24550 [Nostoc sp. 'Peltigera malacea cyanobiont' DB3992]